MEKQDVDKLIDALKDGKWHTQQQIVQKTGVEEYKAKLVLAFLRRFQFIQTDRKTRNIKLTLLTRQLLEKLANPKALSFYEDMIA
jgi:hypothetical protein